MRALDTQDLHQIKMLSADLEKLNADIFCVEQGGVPWDLASFGCTRNDLERWRQFAYKLKETLDEKHKREEKEASAILES